MFLHATSLYRGNTVKAEFAFLWTGLWHGDIAALRRVRF
jgi:hypothetical protein